MTFADHQLVGMLNLGLCLAIVWACICRLNTPTCKHHLRARVRYALLAMGSVASGFQPLLFHTLPGPGETILAATVLAGLVINMGRWTRQYTMTLDEITTTAITPALALLPRGLDDVRARLLLLAIGMQESRFEHRRQLGNGPARGFWQFELGTQASRGGVWGVYLHPATAGLLQSLCRSRGVECKPAAIWSALETDDVLAAGVARLLIVTDACKLPAVDDVDGAWRLYAQRCWRPGKPHPETWPKYHAQARAFLGV